MYSFEEFSHSKCPKNAFQQKLIRIELQRIYQNFKIIFEVTGTSTAA
jgi:hypothetical protein